MAFGRFTARDTRQTGLTGFCHQIACPCVRVISKERSKTSAQRSHNYYYTCRLNSRAPCKLKTEKLRLSSTASAGAVAAQMFAITLGPRTQADTLHTCCRVGRGETCPARRRLRLLQVLEPRVRGRNKQLSG